MLPAPVQLTVPALYRVRPYRDLSPFSILNVAPAATVVAVVAPPSPIWPLNQLTVPVTVRAPLLLTLAARVKFRAVRGAFMLMVPLMVVSVEGPGVPQPPGPPG